MTTVVFVCADAPSIPHAGAAVQVVDGLCARPMQLGEGLPEADRAVLLLHPNAFDTAAVQTALRSIDIDPLSAQLLEVPPDIDATALRVAVVSLKARASAATPSEPEHAKPVLAREVTRRGLFKLPSPIYVAAPLIDDGLCAAGDGCRACVDICPREAYRWHLGRVHYNKDVCEPCGLCVTACPTDAIDTPSVTPAMLAAQIATLIDEAAEDIGVRFVCSRSAETARAPGWYDVVVPCTAMVPGAWLLTAVLMGAGSASALTCTDGGCPLGLDSQTRAAVDFARSALAEASLDPEHVPTEAVPVLTPLPAVDLEHPFSRDGTRECIEALSTLAAAPLAFSHPGATVGVVAIDPSACTLCTQCAQTCPTGAIGAGYEDDLVTLTFDAGGCTNCGQCMLACPELMRGAISVTGRVDVGLIAAGPQAIHHGTVLLCEKCRKPVAPSPMMNRIGELLGDDFDDTVAYLTSRCMDCRGMA